MQITTKLGDLGMTDVADKRVKKGSLIICFLGELDGCMAQMVECGALYPELKEELKGFVEDWSQMAAFVSGYACFNSKRQIELDLKVMELEKSHSHFSFNYPFDNAAASRLNLIRTEVRRCERLFWQMENKEWLELGAYLNRLSDWFYLKQVSIQ